jgi:hypothetical protein
VSDLYVVGCDGEMYDHFYAGSEDEAKVKAFEIVARHSRTPPVLQRATFCDNCADAQPTDEMYHFERLPEGSQVASANAGESASLCAECYENKDVLPTQPGVDE